MTRPSRILLDSAEFEALATRLAARVAPRAADPARVLAALSLVRDGRVVSAGDQPAAPALPPDAGVTRGVPAPYRLTQWVEDGPGWGAVNDRLELDIHGATSMTHLDTTEHFAWDPHPGAVEPGGELLALAATGSVARGVLIDVPGVLGRGGGSDVVELADIHETIERTGTAPRPGDVLYLRFGRSGRARSDAPLGSTALAGLSIECAEWLVDASPSMVVTDEGLDPFPSEVEGQPVPWHLLTLTVLRAPLVDRAMLGPLAAACSEAARWEFLSLVAPLAIPGASGSPVNPLAVL
ncbi:MAG: cyclase family protein [Protaetiibacter sp.]